MGKGGSKRGKISKKTGRKLKKNLLQILKKNKTQIVVGFVILAFIITVIVLLAVFLPDDSNSDNNGFQNIKISNSIATSNDKITKNVPTSINGKNKELKKKTLDKVSNYNKVLNDLKGSTKINKRVSKKKSEKNGEFTDKEEVNPLLESNSSFHKPLETSPFGPVDDILKGFDVGFEESQEQDPIIKGRKLYDLYFRGIHDTYDLRGNKIKGIEPNAREAIKQLEMIISSQESQGTSPARDLINLARIHHFGMHGYEPNPETRAIAEAIYKKVYNSGDNSGDLDRESLDLAREGLEDLEKIKTYGWLNLEDRTERQPLRPTKIVPANSTLVDPMVHQLQEIQNVEAVPTVGRRARRRARLNEAEIIPMNEAVGNRMFGPGLENAGMAFGLENAGMAFGTEFPILDRDTINDIGHAFGPIDLETINFNRAFLRNLAENRRITENNDDARRDNIHGNSPQNTHDHTVLKTVKRSAHKLKQNFDHRKKMTGTGNNLRNENETINEIRNYLHTSPNNDKKSDALKSLLTISDLGNTKLSNTNMSEREALKLVWNRINNEHSGSKDLKQNLFNELADMQEHGGTVCSTGRFDRIIDTLNVVDPDVRIVPKKAIGGEMLTKAAKIRSDMLLERPEPERRALEEGTSPQQQQDSFDQSLKKNILGTLKTDYVDSGIISKTKFDNEVNKWINDI